MSSVSVWDLLTDELLHVAQNQSRWHLPFIKLVVGGCVRKLQTLGSMCSEKCGRDCQENGRKGKTIWWVLAANVGQKS